MRDRASWSLDLGRWWGVSVRLHMLFLLFAACTLYLSWLGGREPDGAGLVALGGMSLAVLLASVMLHEGGHLWAAFRSGGRVEQIVIGPLGGLAPPKVPPDPACELVVAAAGPLVSLAVCLAGVAVLVSTGGGNVLGLLHPLEPANLADGSAWLVVVKLAVWINWLLFLLNLLPAFPFDGGRALRAMLAIRRPGAGYRETVVVVARAAKVVAVGLLIVACLMWSAEWSGLVPPWFALVLLSIFLFFSAQQEENRHIEPAPEEESFGDDYSEDFGILARSDHPAADPVPGPLSRWLEQRRQAQRQRQEAIEAEEERRVDEILARLQQTGMEGLSAEDRDLLERVSARYRSRLGRR